MPGAVPHATLTHITVGLGWDPVRAGKFRRRAKDIDLNVAALSFSGTRFADIAFHEQLTSRDGAIRHLGDGSTWPPPAPTPASSSAHCIAPTMIGSSPSSPSPSRQNTSSTPSPTSPPT
ncbi:TerD family protein [Nocardia sp. NPDC058497]|uniref:TerD family protein n=1 Tax=Nocardia sp. NPDC058497 TaxID=3346529 RepID=UPI00364C347C